jgi:hypothetical protein
MSSVLRASSLLKGVALTLLLFIDIEVGQGHDGWRDAQTAHSILSPSSLYFKGSINE